MRKSKWGLSILTAVLMFSMVTTIAAAAPVQVTVQVDGKNVSFPDAKPYFENSRVLIPVRFVSEALGAKVEYKKETTGNRIERVVYVNMEDKQIRMPVNSDTVLVGDVIKKLDVPARLQQERVYVPLRFVSEAMGSTVGWDQVKKLVSISTGKTVANPSTPSTPTTKPDEEYNMYKTGFKWDEGYTKLAKVLFVNNMKVSNGKLTFTLPKDAKGSFQTVKDGITKLTPGNTYTYPIGEGAGFLTFALIYPGKEDQEAYMVSLDSKGNKDMEKLFGQYNDAIVIVSGNSSGAPLSEVQQIAQKL